MQATSKGYTLLEMLISITLIGLLMVSLVVAVHVGNKAWQRGEARLLQVHAEEERSQFMFQQISSLVPYKVTSANPDMPGDFYILEADANRLRFLSTCGTRNWGRSGLLLDEYAIVRTRDGYFTLALRETPVRDDKTLLRLLIARQSSDPDTGKISIVYQPFFLRESDVRLMTGLRAAEFEYLGAPASGKAPVWASHWEARQDAPYPEAVRIVWLRGNQREEIMVPIRARYFPK